MPFSFVSRLPHVVIFPSRLSSSCPSFRPQQGSSTPGGARTFEAASRSRSDENTECAELVAETSCANVVQPETPFQPQLKQTPPNVNAAVFLNIIPTTGWLDAGMAFEYARGEARM